ncbi:unnamed protein product, partial [Clonostachys byssicola]
LPNPSALVSAALAEATTLATVTAPTLNPEPSPAVEIRANLGSTYDKPERPFEPGHFPFVEVTPSDSPSTLGKRSAEPSSGKKSQGQVHELCRFRVNNAKDARRVWEETGAGEVLDDFVDWMNGNNETGWLWEFQDTFLGNPNYLNCDNFGGNTCRIDHQMCNKMAEKGLAGQYWVLRAVASMNSLLGQLKDSLEINKKKYFDMDKLVASFESGDHKYPAKYPLDTLAQTFRISNMAEAPIDTFSHAAQDAIGVVESLNLAYKLDLATEVLAGVTTSPAFVSEIENRGESRELDQLLKDLGQRYSGTMGRHLQRLMWAALGHEEWTDLPENLLTDTSAYKTDIGKLFADGKWLPEDVSLGLQPFMDQTMLLASQKFLLDLIRSSGGNMLVDPQNLRSWCVKEIEKKGYISHKIMDFGFGKDACVLFQRKRYYPLIVDQEPVLVNDFHMNIEKVYRYLWDCAQDSNYTFPDPMGVMPVGEMKSNGSLPRCYLAMQVFMGNRVSWVAPRRDNLQYLVNNYTSRALIERERMFSNGTWQTYFVDLMFNDLPRWIHGRG